MLKLAPGPDPTVAPTSSSSSNGALQSDLDFLKSLSTTTAATAATNSSATSTTRDVTTSETFPSSSSSSSNPNDITQSLAFLNLSRQLDASIPDSLASTQTAYDALLERKASTKQNGQGDVVEGEDVDNDDADQDEDDDGLDERAILDLLNKMESADLAAQEFEGRLDKLLQGLDGMLESLGAAGESGAADGTTAEDDSLGTASSDKKDESDPTEMQ
ncbi:BQ2448_2826 [Microbotryum intermedium]|uniref:BQ2448_2826 protein n=1 Tax=Microbotryum intermedium TaxID=269621 RepID=A0A238FJ83_9BASI|nr:BQ2448_2826 [Microbotryum intermedium]